MKGYKGFHKAGDGTLTCREMVYEPGKKYTCEGEIVLCERGFHACHELHHVWPFYPNNGENVYYEVECGGEIVESNNGDGKFVCSEIELIREVELSENCTRFVSCCSFSDGFGRVQRGDGKVNYIKTDGTLLSDVWYEFCWSFSEGFGRVQREEDGKWNYIKPDGTYLSDEWYECCWSFSEGFGVVQRDDGKWNYIKPDGTYLSEVWYKFCCSFSEGFGRVQREEDGMYNYIKPDGTLLSKEWYGFCWSFKEGFGRVQREYDEWFYLDKEGNEYDCVDGKYVPRNKNKGFKKFFKRLFKINQ